MRGIIACRRNACAGHAMVEGTVRSLSSRRCRRQNDRPHQTNCWDRSTSACSPSCSRTTKRCGSMRTGATPHTLTLRFPRPYPGDTFVAGACGGAGLLAGQNGTRPLWPCPPFQASTWSRSQHRRAPDQGVCLHWGGWPLVRGPGIDCPVTGIDWRDKRELSCSGDREAEGRARLEANRIDARLIHNRPQPVHSLSQSPMCEIAWRDSRGCLTSAPSWLVLCAKVLTAFA